MDTRVKATVREISHRVRVDLDDAPPVKTVDGRRRKPTGLRLEYGIGRYVARVDVVVEFRDSAEHFPPVGEMPEWMRGIVEANRPADVYSPAPNRRTGMGGWDLPAPKSSGTDVSDVLSRAADDIALDRDYQLPPDGPLKPGMDRAEKLLRRQAASAKSAGL